LKIRYIHHSCFIIETEHSFLIFDYYKSKPYRSDFDFDFIDLIAHIMRSNKGVYIFASHSHSDHYNSEILAWGLNKNNVYYILSDDIELYNQIENCYFVKPNEQISINDIKINTFGSTDCGVSFMVSLENKNIFHAGDLNWWKWNDDTLIEEKEMENAFKGIINNIASLKFDIDVALFPIDKRLEENFMCGGEFFIQELKPRLFIPMHFLNNFNTTNEFIQSQKSNIYRTKIIKINHDNELLVD